MSTKRERNLKARKKRRATAMATANRSVALVKAASSGKPQAMHKPLAALPFLPGLTGSFVRRYGKPLIVTLPAVSPDEDRSEAFHDVLATIEGADVVLFPDVWPGDLDGFFRLRLAQILRDRPPSPALSVVVLAPELSGRPLAGGFAERFRSGWPFARCAFVTTSADPDALSGQLGLAVERLEDGAALPDRGSMDGGATDAERGDPDRGDPDRDDPDRAILHTDARAGQKIALHLQMPWGRCGSTTMFENQIEDLVRAGYLTIRLFSDGRLRRGPTLSSMLEQIIQENSTHAGGHIDGVAVPDGPPLHLPADGSARDWAMWLASSAFCRIRDTDTAKAAARAEVVIANSIDAAGAALHLAPGARMLLDVRDDRTTATRDWLIDTGRSESEIEAGVAEAMRAQSGILAIPDICSFVSATEMAQLGPLCQRSAVVVPRIYTRAVEQSGFARFDVLVAGDGHSANLASLRWFLDEVWRPYLEPAAVSVAVVGRAGERIDAALYASPSLFFLGFVDDLDTFRSVCRLTVVADRSGTGISIKMLSTLAADHPLVTTSTGLRGLDPAISGRLPAHDDAADFAADILELLSDPERLAERRRLVSAVRKAVEVGAGYVDLLRSIEVVDETVLARRRDAWAMVVAAAPPADPTPYLFDLDSDFPMSGTDADIKVLRDGWHEPETWGRWTDGAEASLRIELPAAATELLKLELDIHPSPVGAPLVLRIDDTVFPAIQPIPGTNFWDIPAEIIEGRSSFVVTLRVAEAVCPARISDSPDERILGIGVAAVRVRSRQPTVCRLGEYLPVNRDSVLREVLLSGWHALEPWGCWSSGKTASLRLRIDQPLSGPIRLELDLAAPQGGVEQEAAILTLAVNGWAAPGRVLQAGPIVWDLPADTTQGETRLLIMLSVSRTICPLDSGGSDDRVLGLGLRGVRLRRFEPVVAVVGTPVRLGKAAEPEGMLTRGWHKPEAWGCWTSGLDAELRLSFVAPLVGSFRLEMDLSVPGVCPELTVLVSGVALPGVMPVAGRNAWVLPDGCLDGRQDVSIELRVSSTVRPAQQNGSVDNRTLGIGVRSVGLHREAASVCPIGSVVRISSALGDSGMLLDGWHKPERWGCWSSGRSASMRLQFDKPLRGSFGIEVNMMPPLRDGDVLMEVNGVVLGASRVREGANEWSLPLSCTDGQNVLDLRFIVEDPVRPMDVVKGSVDDRIIGVGIKSLMVYPE